MQRVKVKYSLTFGDVNNLGGFSFSPMAETLFYGEYFDKFSYLTPVVTFKSMQSANLYE